MTLRTSIEREGQPYVDEPDKIAQPKHLSEMIAALFGTSLQPIILSYQRIRLNWVKPKGN